MGFRNWKFYRKFAQMSSNKVTICASKARKKGYSSTSCPRGKFTQCVACDYESHFNSKSIANKWKDEKKICSTKSFEHKINNISATLPLRFYTLVISTIAKCKGNLKVQREFTNRFLKYTWITGWIVFFDIGQNFVEQQYWSKVLRRDSSAIKNFLSQFRTLKNFCDFASQLISWSLILLRGSIYCKLNKKQISTSLRT